MTRIVLINPVWNTRLFWRGNEAFLPCCKFKGDMWLPNLMSTFRCGSSPPGEKPWPLPTSANQKEEERQGPSTPEGAPGQSLASPDPPAVPSVLFTSPGMVCALFLSFTEHPKSPSLISPDEVRKMLAPREKWAVVSLWNTTQALWSLGGNLNYQELDSQHYKDWWNFTCKVLSLERF